MTLTKFCNTTIIFGDEYSSRLSSLSLVVWCFNDSIFYKFIPGYPFDKCRTTNTLYSVIVSNFFMNSKNGYSNQLERGENVEI